MENLSKLELEELKNIAKNQPVKDGNRIDAESTRSPHSSIYKLKEKGLIVYFDDENGGWCLTEKGKAYFNNPTTQ